MIVAEHFVVNCSLSVSYRICKLENCGKSARIVEQESILEDNIHQANEDISSTSHRLLYLTLPNNPKLVHVQSCPALCDRHIPWTLAHVDCPWNFPGKNIGMGCHSVLETTL